MIDPTDPPEIQIEKQGRIIEALIRRAARERDADRSAHGAFRSAIALQGEVWAKTRDLERATSELADVRSRSERTRQSLSGALSAMDVGFALFSDDALELCNDLFRGLLPDIARRVRPGLARTDYFEAVARSSALGPLDGPAQDGLAQARAAISGPRVLSFVLPLAGDRWFQISLQRTGEESLVVLQTDITDLTRRNRTERRDLIDGQAHYLQAAIENLASGLCTLSSDRKVVLHNDRFRELLDLPVTLVQRGTDFGRLMHYVRAVELIAPEQTAEMDSWVDELCRAGRLAKRLRHVSGRVLGVHAHRLPDEGFLLDVRDVTLESRSTEVLERRVAARTSALTEANARLTAQSEVQSRVEEELRLAKERAEAAVSSKTRFLAAASHDLLQPVNAAKLLISTLGESVSGSDVAPMVERLESSFASIESLLHALLDISRLDSAEPALTPSDVCLGPLIQGVVADQAPLAARKGVRLRVVESDAYVRSDPRYLLRSVQNLVVNAIQYTPPGGKVLLGCRRRGDEILLEVRDTGVGISKSDQLHIFDEFARAGEAVPGTGVGLGLSIVERTCRHLGHRLSLRSAPGCGSAFTIAMARVDRAPARRDADDHPLPERATDGLDVIALAVENDPDVLYAMVRLLEGWGVAVLGARDVDEAVEQVRALGMAPDVILADYQLTGARTGVDAIAAVRAEVDAPVPAIMITAYRGADLVQRGAAEGFSVLTKPVEPARLRSLIGWKTARPCLAGRAAE